VPLKRIDLVIEAVVQCDGVSLVIVGDGPERGRLERVARVHGIAERVHFTGQCSQAETMALMATCDVLVLNSTHEGFPHAILEAMALGLPVVATAVGGTPELLEDGVNGLLIPSDAPGALPEVIMKLHALPQERQRLAIGARCTAARYSLPVMVAQTEALLQSVVSAGDHGS
jgi:glycosyltransferase involved in cell wall biosynthesis